EPDDPAPAQAGELRAQIRRCKPKRPEIVMGGQLQTFYAPPHVPEGPSVEKIIDSGVYRACRSANSLRFGFKMRLPDIFDIQHRQHYALEITQRDLAASRLEPLRKSVRHVEGDGNRPEHAVPQSHFMTHTFILFPVHAAAQRREPATHKKLQVADLPTR